MPSTFAFSIQMLSLVGMAYRVAAKILSQRLRAIVFIVPPAGAPLWPEISS